MPRKVPMRIVCGDVCEGVVWVGGGGGVVREVVTS